MEYELRYDLKVSEKILEIQQFMRLMYSEEVAQTALMRMMGELEALKIMPESGWSADEKVGKSIVPHQKTYGQIINQKSKYNQYLVFYQIIGNTVTISHLIPARSNYLKLFR